MCYQKILEIEPGWEKIVKEYLTQVDLEEERECQESKAWEEFDKGEEKATTVLQLLKKLDRPDQFPLYYCGGLNLLSHAITDCQMDVNGCSFRSREDSVDSSANSPILPCRGTRLVGNLMVCISTQSQLETTALAILENFATENKYEHAVSISGVCLGFLSDPDGGIITVSGMNLTT
ncbi:unnamed protein product [Coregonus sp. 'balchen']|nr:unnamed protein product [Coregonus sp. 'balchen']